MRGAESAASGEDAYVSVLDTFADPGEILTATATRVDAPCTSTSRVDILRKRVTRVRVIIRLAWSRDCSSY